MLDSYQTQQWRDVPVERGPRVDNGSAGRFIEAVQQFRDLCNERDHAKKRVAELEEMVKSAEKSLTAMGEGLLREDEVFRLIAQVIHQASTSVNGQMAATR